MVTVSLVTTTVTVNVSRAKGVGRENLVRGPEGKFSSKENNGSPEKKYSFRDTSKRLKRNIHRITG